MSATTTSPPTAAPPTIGTEWKTPAGVVAIVNIALLLAALVYAGVMRDTQSLALLTGAIITNAGTATNYYLGSSRGSQTKDATIAAQLPVSVVAPAVAPGATP